MPDNNMPSNRIDITEETARTFVYCPACAEKKDRGMVLCWTCWREFKPLAEMGFGIADFCNGIEVAG